MSIVLLAIGVAGCGDGEEQAEKETRFCQLVRELDRKAEGAFMDLPADASPEQVRKAMEYFASNSAVELDEIQRVAPARIRADLRVAVAAQRQAAGGDVGALTRDSAAIERMAEMQRKECPHRR